jgi:spermidine/putrescine-binding protein
VKDYSYFAFPTIDEDVEDSLLVVYDGLILHAGSQSKPGAKRAMAYFVDNEQQKELSNATGGLSPNIRIESSFYPPIKQKALSMYEKAGHLTYALDLSTPTQVAEIVLKGLVEFMEFPEQYRSILQDIDLKAKEVFDILYGER